MDKKMDKKMDLERQRDEFTERYRSFLREFVMMLDSTPPSCMGHLVEIRRAHKALYEQALACYDSALAEGEE